MALSRAAAAAARKAAKNRGLQGNRAEDGSMLSEIPSNKPQHHIWKTDKQPLSKETHLLMEDEIPLLDDAGLNKAWLDTKQEIRELREMDIPESAEMVKAQDRLKLIEEEMDNRGVINRDDMLYQEDVDEAAGRYT